MKNTFKILFSAILTLPVFGQNLFPIKLDNCNTSSFCLDCGDIKGGFNENLFQEMLDKVESKLNLNGVIGSVYFQVLIESNGKGCVLSHSDKSNSYITKSLLTNMNKFKAWIPASTDGTLEDRTSINLIITIKNNNLNGIVERVSMPAFKESLRGSRPPEIFNEHYSYKNEKLENYIITAWHRENTALPNDRNEKIKVDSTGRLWYTMDNSMGIMSDGKFMTFEQNIHAPGMSGFSHSAIEIDNNNNIWISSNKGIYSYNGLKWNYYQPSEIGIDGATEIISNDFNNNLIFCTQNGGLTINSSGNWLTINQDSIPQLPSNGIFYANYDSKERLWIGTFGGTIMIDSSNHITSFNEGKSIMKGKSITSMTEDNDGNIYFGLYECDGKGDNKNEGIAVLKNDESWQQFTSENSGMPFNHTNDLVYDSFENVLWISTDRAGIVRYDLNGNWENYHSENSGITTSSVYDIEIDRNGIIYLGTTLGIVKIERK